MFLMHTHCPAGKTRPKTSNIWGINWVQLCTETNTGLRVRWPNNHGIRCCNTKQSGNTHNQTQTQQKDPRKTKTWNGQQCANEETLCVESRFRQVDSFTLQRTRSTHWRSSHSFPYRENQYALRSEALLTVRSLFRFRQLRQYRSLYFYKSMTARTSEWLRSGHLHPSS